MIIRILEPEEYGRLDEITEPDRIAFDPANTIVAVAEDEGRIVGRMTIMILPHIEATWIDPEYRGGTVGIRMHNLLIEMMRGFGATMIAAYAPTEQLEDYCRRLGYERFASVLRKEI